MSIEPIAIIGMSGRFPGARDLGELWENLRGGTESISRFSAEDLAAAGLDPALLRHPGYVNAGGVLADIEWFDAGFFGYTPREAEIMDPQQRIFLEVAWETLEQAGYDPNRYRGAIGVYAGAGMSKYLFNLYANPALMALVGGVQVVLGNDKDHLTTRAAYKLNLRGPAVTVQTACSTSLVAVCMACQSLLDYQADMALAGGVSISIPQAAGYMYQEGGIGSPDGHCRAFDARAQGTVGGNGVGVVLLKRLADALADGDSILAVVRGFAINNDGSAKVGYTAPSIEGQAEVIAMAQAMGGVGPETISYVEAHGTGTALGDPIEIAALTQVFRARTGKAGFCAIGSIKTNIGHLDPAAGVAGLIKTVLALQHGMLPPSLHFERANPQIDFTSSPFFVNSRLTEWATGVSPRRAGVSSFGIGGTNAHVIVEEAPAPPSRPAARPWQLLTLSARTEGTLEAATSNLVAHLSRHPDLACADVAYTLQVGRRAFRHRRILACRDSEDAIAALDARDPRRVWTGVAEQERPVVFMFPGQGVQYLDMAADLFHDEPAFRDEVERCAEVLRPHLGRGLTDLLYPSVRGNEATGRLTATASAQPALFVVEYALARLWMAWGIRPRAMIGHSVGEFVAACLSGVFSLEDALTLVAARGRLMQTMPGGAMLAVPLSEGEVAAFLSAELALAAVNAPDQCVVSGGADAISGLEARLAERGVACRRLHTSHAFHSHLLEPIVAPFRAAVSAVARGAPGVPFVSNVTGTWITETEATAPDYWAAHLRQPVRFSAGLGEILKGPAPVLIEVGPGRTLSALARRHADPAQALVLPSLPHPRARQPDKAVLLDSLGRLWVAGASVDWAAVHRPGQPRRVPLPTYPFERQRYWVAPERSSGASVPRTGSLARKTDMTEWFSVPSWHPAPLPTAPAPRRRGVAGECWLVFRDPCGLAEALEQRLTQAGADVISVSPGPHFTRLGERAYVIDPRASDDYVAVLRALAASGRRPARICHLWSVTADDRSRSWPESLADAHERGFMSLVFLAQAIGEERAAGRVHVAVVSSAMQAVTGDDLVCPEKATLLGPCRVIPCEYPHIACQSIDVIFSPDDPTSVATLADRLSEELAGDGTDEVVAYRGGTRWLQALVPVRVEDGGDETALLRRRGVYLITGGLGGIGLALAAFLARALEARLVLVGRTALPEREQWQQRLSALDDRDEIGQKIRAVQALEGRGAEIMVASADVTDLTAMRVVMAAATERFGPLDGVIHAAGVAGGGLVHFKTPEIAARVLAPKVQGALVLDTLLAGVQPLLVVLCSSLASLLGGLGQADYCGANAFLDALAHAPAFRKGRHVVSVNWDTWKEVGMAVRTPVPRDLEAQRAEHLRRGIRSAEGVEAFRRVVGTRLPQVAVATADLAALRQIARPLPAAGARSGATLAEASRPKHARRDMAVAYAAPRNRAERTIAEVWQDLLGVRDVGIHDNFFELGGDSLLAIQVASRLRDALRAELPLRALFEAPSVAELAARLRPENAAVPPPDDIRRLLELAESLPDEEIKRSLASPPDERGQEAVGPP